MGKVVMCIIYMPIFLLKSISLWGVQVLTLLSKGKMFVENFLNCSKQNRICLVLTSHNYIVKNLICHWTPLSIPNRQRWQCTARICMLNVYYVALTRRRFLATYPICLKISNKCINNEFFCDCVVSEQKKNVTLQPYAPFDAGLLIQRFLKM